MRLRLTQPAGRQLDRALTYIVDRNPQGARHAQARIAEVMDLLLAYPLAGTQTARPGQRRILASPYPYAVTYRVADDEIAVLGIRHTARRPSMTLDNALARGSSDTALSKALRRDRSALMPTLARTIVRAREIAAMTATTRAAGALAALLALSGAATARPLVPAEERDQPYSGNVRACTDPGALGYIKGQFVSREAEYWHSGLSIVGFDDVHEIGMRSNGLDYIPRRYCTARALMSDNKLRPVTYSIDEAGAGIGFSDNVVWCVTGLDRDNSFAPACLEARP